MTPSSYQHEIYTWVRTGTGSAIIDAVAGSGKTTTIVEVCRQIPASQSVRLFAFNRDIAGTLKVRLAGARNVEASTYHSSGYRALLTEFRAKVDTDKGKMKDLIREVLEETDRRAYGDDLLKLVGLAKGMGLGALCADTPGAWKSLIDAQDLDINYLIPPGTTDTDFDAQLLAEQRRVIEMAQGLLATSNRAAQEQFAWRIDFDDHLYLPILWNLPLPTYDWVMVDEAQDTNAIQREFLLRSLTPGGRVIAVGDPRQAIYAWRGASHDAMDLIAETFETRTLPLSVCYRCGTTIVRKAQEIVSHIEAAPGAPAGEVLEDAPVSALLTLPADAAILCRNNAPLVQQAYALIAEGIPCRVLGRDIGEGLKKLVYKLHPDSPDDLEVKLTDYLQRETIRYRKLKQEHKLQSVTDRVTCLLTIIESCREEDLSVEGLLEEIDELFGDRVQGKLTLSTIHKAKGQEWDTVAIIGRYLIPSRYAKTVRELRQEDNLLYVAYTRARRTLLIIDDKPAWLKKKEAKAQGDEVDLVAGRGAW